MSKIIVIVGPTGVGKTKLSIELAKYYNAEIISADSVQIYKELNIGSAKVTLEEMENIKHHFINIKNIDEEYSVFNFQKEGRNILNKLINSNKNVVIVGGTGLYIKALLYDYKFNGEKTKDKNNKIYDFYTIGLTTEREILYQKINNRVDKMLSDGLIEEVKNLDINSKKLHSIIGYKEIISYLNKQLSKEEAIELIKKNSRNYAKRQYTWFNNQMEVVWFNVNFDNFNENVVEIIKYIGE